MFRNIAQALVVSFALLGSPVSGASQEMSAPNASASNTTLDQAIEYALPLVLMGRNRLAAVGTDDNPGNVPLNKGFFHIRTLANSTRRDVTTPNSDTITSRAYLDLAAGPVNVTIPDTDGRYYSMALLDMPTNNFYVGGRRRTGTLRNSWLVVGPHWKGELPPGNRVIQAPSNDVLLLIRTLVSGPEDLANVTALQDTYSLTALGSETPPRWQGTPPNGTTPDLWVDMANLMLARNPPPSYELALIEKLKSVGICGAECSWSKLSPELQAQWNARLPEVQATMRSAKPPGIEVNGWTYPGVTTGDFGNDYALRAQMAVSGLLALPTQEAVYPLANSDTDGQPLTGASRYRLTLPPGVPQVGAFWSLTLYELFPDGSLFLVDNAINRFAIGDRTPDLVTNTDGSIDLWVQNQEPTEGAQKANWLPSPPGAFTLFFRAYEPGADFRDLRKPLPALERLS